MISKWTYFSFVVCEVSNLYLVVLFMVNIVSAFKLSSMGTSDFSVYLMDKIDKIRVKILMVFIFNYYKKIINNN